MYHKYLNLFIALLIAGSATAQQLQKVLYETAAFPDDAQVGSYIDSGYVLQTHLNIPQNQITPQQIILLDKHGNVKRERAFTPGNTALAMASDPWSQNVLYRNDGGLYVYNTIFYTNDQTNRGDLVYSLDSNLNVIWSNNRFTSAGPLGSDFLNEINGALYLTSLSHQSGSLVLTLNKFTAAGITAFSKSYATNYISYVAQSTYKNKNNQIIALTDGQTDPATLSDSLSFGNLLLLDTLGNILLSRRYNHFFPDRVYQTSSGNYLLSGRLYDGNPNAAYGFGLFDTLFNPVWLKKIEDSPYYSSEINGMYEDNAQHFILASSYNVQGSTYPFFFFTDHTGNLLQNYCYNQNSGINTSFIKDNYNRFIWTACDTMRRSIFCSTDNLAHLNSCGHDSICNFALLPFQTVTTSPAWTVAPLDSFQSFLLTTMQSNPTFQDYCNDPGAIDASFAVPDTICLSDSINLFSSGNLRMGTSEWFISGNTPGYYLQLNVTGVKFDSAGLYQIMHVHNRLGCTDTIIHKIVVLNNRNSGLLNLTFCDSANFTAHITAITGGSFYQWNTGQTDSVITIHGPGIYWYRTNFGCGVVTDSIQINLVRAHQLTLPADTLLCADKLPVLIAADTGFISYVWNTNYTGRVLTATDSGLYIVNATDVCTIATDSTRVIIKAMPQPKAVQNSFISTNGAPITLEACAEGSRYDWTPTQDVVTNQDSAIIVNPGKTLQYVCTVTNEAGCSISCDYTVIVQSELLIPTAFSPNGDGVNDVFRVLNKNIKLLLFSVYNRWGELIFSTQDIAEGWDGTYKGLAQPLGVYVWTLRYQELSNGLQKFGKGNVTLLR